MLDSLREQVASLVTAIKTGIESRLKDVHTSLPGIIVSFDAATQTATVQPAIKRIFKENSSDGTVVLVPDSLAQLINVPVVFPRGGGYSLTFPVKPGDECLITFSERSIDIWHQKGGVQKPNGKRFHNLSDGICFVGLSSIPNKIGNFNTSNVELRNDARSTYVAITPAAGIILKTSSGEFTQSAGGALAYTGTSATFNCPTTFNQPATFNQPVSIQGLDFLSHGHNQSSDSSGDGQQKTQGAS